MDIILYFIAFLFGMFVGLMISLVLCYEPDDD